MMAVERHARGRVSLCESPGGCSQLTGPRIADTHFPGQICPQLGMGTCLMPLSTWPAYVSMIS